MPDPLHGLEPALYIDSADASLPVQLIGPAHVGVLPSVPGMVLPRLQQISSIQRPLSVPGIASAPTSNMTAEADNADGSLSTLWAARPPVRMPARVALGGRTVFQGVVTSIGAGASLSLSLESGMDRPLSDRLPLRTSAVWGGWRSVRTLPWGWGHVTVEPIQYSDDQRVFALLDHPAQGVDEVRRDDVPTQAWAFSNQLDSTGRAIAFIELAQPLAEGERLSVTLRGRMHPDTGQLLHTPAEILHDVLAHLAGAPVRWADFDDWRAATAELRLGGLLDDASITIRAACDQICQSAGAAWAAAMPGIAIQWPPTAEPAAPALPVTAQSATDMRADTSATGLVTELRVLYDWDHAAARYRRAVQLSAPEAVRQYGTLELEWPAPWLRSPRHAEQLGQRMLGWLARPRWRASWAMPLADIATGAWVDIDHPLSPIQGRHRLIHAELDTSRATISCTAEAPVGPAPVIETTRLSTAFEPLIQPGITVEVAQDAIIFTARDERGQPLPRALITLDGQASRIADDHGRVSFPATRGRHVLLIEASGYPPYEVELVL